LSDLGARALIVQAGSDSPAVGIARERGIPVFEMAVVPDGPAGVFTLSGEESAAPVRAGFARPDDVAIVLHTFGSTSRLKMVPLTHANICASAHNVGRALALTAEDRCMNVMPLFHIHGL